MNTQSIEQPQAFAEFTQAAERYCLGLSNVAMRSYALRYLTFLQAKSQGAEHEEPFRWSGAPLDGRAQVQS